MGLRERKKARTRDAISGAAIALFLERGYEAVSIAEIAAAADVSRRTLFVYFPTKDDLVLSRFADHEDEPARVVRERAPDVAPLAALHRHLRSGLDRRDPITGLCDHPDVVRFYRLLLDTPALSVAMVRYQTRGEEALATALGGRPLTARLPAAQILVVLRTLEHANQTRIAAGRSANDLADTATAEADEAFALLATGLAPYRGA